MCIDSERSSHTALLDDIRLNSIEEIHSVGRPTMNNVETSYFTQLKICYPNDNVPMSVGHLDHVLIVYSSMKHVSRRTSKRQ